MKLINVHQYNSNREIMINIDHITAIRNNDSEGGYIQCVSGYYIYTKETMIEIWTLVSEANNID